MYLYVNIEQYESQHSIQNIKNITAGKESVQSIYPAITAVLLYDHLAKLYYMYNLKQEYNSPFVKPATQTVRLPC